MKFNLKFAGNLAVAGAVLSLSLFGCTKKPVEDNVPTEPPPKIANWIVDTGFDRGAMVFNPVQGSVRVNGKIDFGKNIEGQVSDWIVTQWNSKSDLAKIAGKREGDQYVYEDKNKKVALADDGTVTLKVDTGAEYDKPRSRPTDPWIHLYLEQRYKKPYPLTGDRLDIQLEARIPESVSLMTEESYDPGLHASIAVFYLILKDLGDSGQFINFCVPIYDNRQDIPEGEWHLDSGFNPAGDTHQLIYTLDGSRIYDKPTGNGEWHRVDANLKPYVEEALAIAKENGFMQDVAYEGLGLSAIYIGWETPGVFRSELQIRNMSVYGQ